MKISFSAIVIIFIICLLLLFVTVMIQSINKGIILKPQQNENIIGLAEPININQADNQQLQLLPGIGEKLADNIVRYRNETGPFLSIEDLQNVAGIGPDIFNQISHYITVGG